MTPDAPADPADDTASALLNLAAVARMMHADHRVAAEEAELLRDLLHASALPDRDEASARAWAAAPPDLPVVASLAMFVEQDGRAEALALAWVAAHADGEVVPAELVEHEALADVLGLADAAAGARADVEAGFFGSALAVLGAAAHMARLSGEPGRAWFDAAVADAGLPADVAARAGAWFDAPRPLHAVLSEAAGLAPDFQEALLGNLWAAAHAAGAPDEVRRALFARFERACGVDDERVARLLAEWGPDEENGLT